MLDVVRDYRQECIDRTKAARARMAEAARKAQRALQEREEAEQALRLQREAEIEARQAARAQKELAQFQWRKMSYRLLASEKRRAKVAETAPIEFTPQPFNSRRTIRTIIEQVAAAAGVSETDIVSERRTASVVMPRQFAMWRARNETPQSLPAIARMFGGRDHTTCLHACRKTEQRLAAGLIPQALLATIPKGVDV